MIKSRYLTLVLLIGHTCSQTSHADILGKTDEERFKQAQSLDMGGIRFYPMLTTGIGYNDNIYETRDDKRSSMIARVAPQLNFVVPADQHRIDFGLEVNDVRYQDYSDDNYTDNNAYIALQAQPGLRHKVSVLLENMVKHAERGTDLSEGFNPDTNAIAKDGETIIDAPIELTDRLANIKYIFGVPNADGHIRLEATKLDRQYNNFENHTRYFDRNELGGSATFLWRVLPATAWAIEGRTKRIEYPNQQTDVVLDSRENTLLTGFEWDATQRLSGNFRIGRKQKNFDSPEVDDAAKSTIEFTGTFKPDELSIFEVNAERNPRETVGTGAFIDAESISASWQHKWMTRLETKVEVKGERLEYANVSRADGIRALNLGVGYDMRRWLTIRMDANLHEKTSDEAAYEYTQNQYWVSADITL